MSVPDTNSRRTRIDPVFGGLAKLSDPTWPAHLLGIAHGLAVDLEPGALVAPPQFEYPVEASRERLDWLIEHSSELGHKGDVQAEVIRRAGSDDPRLRRLEGTTYADCLIECEKKVIWIEGKRLDWLSPATKWDPKRDQLARSLEAAWLTGTEKGKDFCVLVCHETALRKEEQKLVDGYRSGELTDGLPHLDEESRRQFMARIGTVTWREIVNTWPQLRDDPRLADC